MKNIQLMCLLGALMIFQSCKHSDFQTYSSQLDIDDQSYNLIVTSNLDCHNCIDQIIYGNRNLNEYYGLIFSHTKKASLLDFSYVDETKDWISWQITYDENLFLELIEFSENKKTPVYFEVENKKLKSVKSLK